MGNSESGAKGTGHSHPSQANSQAPRPNLAHTRQRGTFRFRAIADKYSSLEEVQQSLRKEGLESSNLVVAVDFTKSNEWTGKHSFGGRSLHYIGPQPNPYEEAISIIGKTLQAFDDDNLIPCYGFGDSARILQYLIAALSDVPLVAVSTSDRAVFSFLPNNQPLQGMESLVWRYRELCPVTKLAGPTSFAPAIRQAAKIVAESGGQYHILLIVADGQVTRSSDLEPGQLSVQESETVQAIVEASNLPLSIIMVGVGDGPWDTMKEFDDMLPARNFDNFQFVNFTELSRQFALVQTKKETMFALRALMEIPEQYRIIQGLGLLGQRSWGGRAPPVLDPPGTPVQPVPPQPATAFSPPPAGYPPPAPVGYPMGPPPPPEMFLCPITQEIMVDPVIASDGFTYERSAIEEWLRSHSTSPMTNQAVSSTLLTPNHMLRSAILEYKQRQGVR